MRVAGIDDAGRGPIIGPLVIAGVLLDAKDLPRLRNLGVKDSKLLSPGRREKIAEEIKKIALKYEFIMLAPAEIDRVVEAGRKYYSLNRLEAQAMAKVITRLQPNVAYVDASDSSAERFKKYIIETLPLKVQIISEHKADLNYPIVSAASILAKVERDKVIYELRERYGDLGSGYAADSKTIEFLENWIKRVGSYPDFVRKSWKPAKRIKTEAETKQRRI